MDEINCEIALTAKMAEADGEENIISSERLSFHFSNCENCRRESEQMQSVDILLKRQARREQQADLWSAIEKRIGQRATSRIGWKPFVLLGVLLVVYKLLEMLPARDLGPAFKLVPLIFVVALFVSIKENPFKIKTEFALEN